MQKHRVTLFWLAVICLAMAGRFSLAASSADYAGSVAKTDDLGKAAAAAGQAGFALPENGTAGQVPAAQPGKVVPGEPGVVITSFVGAGHQTRAAELCGKVSGADAEYSVVRIVADPKEDKPGIYNVLAGKEGDFCAVIVSYTGTATASVRVLDREVSSTPAVMSSGDSRE